MKPALPPRSATCSLLHYHAATQPRDTPVLCRRAVFGPTGEKIISALVAVSALTSINATVIVGARTNYAVGLDWRKLGWLAEWNAEKGTPGFALAVQCLAALAPVATGCQRSTPGCAPSCGAAQGRYARRVACLRHGRRMAGRQNRQG
jgi:hypothetical protein